MTKPSLMEFSHNIRGIPSINFDWYLLMNCQKGAPFNEQIHQIILPIHAQKII